MLILLNYESAISEQQMKNHANAKIHYVSYIKSLIVDIRSIATAGAGSHWWKAAAAAIGSY